MRLWSTHTAIRRTWGVAAACCLLAWGCSRHDTPPRGETSAAAPPAATATPSTGTVTGKVTVPGSGIPAIIVLDPKPAGELPAQTDMPVMDQVSLTFGPPLLFVRTHQPAEFRNSDDTLHNVHVTHEDTREPQFNVAIPTGEHYRFTFKRDGFYHVGCDIHPAMSAAVFASASPYVTLAADDGSFTVEGIPPGAYVIKVYAGGRHLERQITVANGGNSVTF